MKIVEIYYQDCKQLHSRHHINHLEQKHGEYIRYNECGIVVERLYFNNGLDITIDAKKLDYNKVAIKLTFNIPVFSEDV